MPWPRAALPVPQAALASPCPPAATSEALGTAQSPRGSCWWLPSTMSSVSVCREQDGEQPARQSRLSPGLIPLVFALGASPEPDPTPRTHRDTFPYLITGLRRSNPPLV